jgi:hypothetical protein
VNYFLLMHVTFSVIPRNTTFLSVTRILHDTANLNVFKCHTGTLNTIFPIELLLPTIEHIFCRLLMLVISVNMVHFSLNTSWFSVVCGPVVLKNKK